jgi:mono/diheme cytochrome c family protein
VNRNVWVLIAAMLLLLPVTSGCGLDLPGRPRPGDRPGREDQDQAGQFEALYARNCAGCHGAGGILGPAPPLNDPLFLAIVPDSVLATVIAQGRPGTPMPAFAQSRGGPLTDAQVKVLAEGLKPLWGRPHAQQGKEKEKEKEPAPVPGYLVAQRGETSRGTKVFQRACAGCHGDDGAGMDDGAGPLHDPAFLALISDQALRRLAITGRPDLRMPSFERKDGRSESFQPLSSEEISDLVALLGSWRTGGP